MGTNEVGNEGMCVCEDEWGLHGRARAITVCLKTIFATHGGGGAAELDHAIQGAEQVLT